MTPGIARSSGRAPAGGSGSVRDRRKGIETAAQASLSAGFANASTLIPELRGAVLVINASFPDGEQYAETTRIHEEKHIINKLVEPIDQFGKYAKLSNLETNEFKKRELEQIFNQDKITNEERAKDEILAYLKGGHDIQKIKEILLEKRESGGLYDYFEQDRNFYYSHPDYKKFGPELINETSGRTENKYKQNINQALKAVGQLINSGFSRNKLIGLLQTERLDQWGKLYTRLRTIR